MPSSISNSENSQAERPGFVRLTASDRPGVAQPVPERDIPHRPWGPMAVVALLLALTLIGGWEWYWRDFHWPVFNVADSCIVGGAVMLVVFSLRPARKDKLA